MRILIQFILLLFFCHEMRAQIQVEGNVQDKNGSVIPFASVHIKESNQKWTCDENGYFKVQLSGGKFTFVIVAAGYLPSEQIIDVNTNILLQLVLHEAEFNLHEIEVNAKNDARTDLINKIDMQLRPLQSSQDLLRMVPGLFTSQHAGGGKAEQIFFRGFDVDHGTDFAIYVDGMPVNMTSHAHGQGYADLHFLIPETVGLLEVNKGPYNAAYGDLATSGSGEFKTLTMPDKNVAKLEYGSFNTQRLLVITDILGNRHLLSKRREHFYFAGEYRYTDSYFLSKQNFKRFNLFTKYTGELNNGSTLSISASTFRSGWSASGQIPTRKVEDGTISPYGSIDDTEGGLTGRTNLNFILHTPLKNGMLKQQLFYSRYDFDLYSNFTFFLIDTVHGDQIRQTDHRDLFGYSATFNRENKIGEKRLTTTIGAGLRYDLADIQLLHTQKRVYLNDIVKGKLNQLNTWVYADENFFITEKFILNAGARLDVYQFKFQNQTFDTASGNVMKALISPKLNFIYNYNSSVQFFVKSGYGFHSNDARAVVVGKLENSLARALGYEAGTTFKFKKNWMINIALWSLHLESELVYVGDEGIVEAAGRTKRIGIDAGVRYQLAENWYLDGDVNINRGRLADEAENADRIPLAPWFTSLGGLSYKKSKGLNGSIRYRYMANRPANENYSLTAEGYCLVDLVMNYSLQKMQLGVTVENLLNSQWKEAQFATESRLPGETSTVNEIHYTPGTPFFIKGSVTINF